MNLIIVLLCIGFIIAIILSWIYDIHPEGGIVKTEPANIVKEEPVLPSSKGWKIASYISFVVIVGLIVLNIIPRKEKKDILEKSIAVLPFIYYNTEPEAEDIGDAFANEIITQLYKIRGFDRIISHTSTVQYKGPHNPPCQSSVRSLVQTTLLKVPCKGRTRMYPSRSRLFRLPEMITSGQRSSEAGGKISSPSGPISPRMWQWS